jgi:two-component system response regulator WspF
MESVFEDISEMPLKIAANAETGLEAARMERPDLIMMDIQLPGMGGIEAKNCVPVEKPAQYLLLPSARQL